MATTFSQLNPNQPGPNDNFAFDSVSDGNTYRATLDALGATAGAHAIGTVADLQNAPTPATATNGLPLLGYNTPLDGGGGTIVWDPNQDKQEHDGGMIISPTHGVGVFGDTQDANWYQPDPNDNGLGAWVRPFPGHVDITHYGAQAVTVADQTDSTFAIQAAIDFLFNNNILGEVYIPASEEWYRFTQIDLRGQEIGLVGAGREASRLLILDSFALGDYAIIQHHSKQFIKNLTLSGNSSNVSDANCIDAGNNTYNGEATFSNLTVQGFNGAAFTFNQSNLTTLIDVTASRCDTGIIVENSSPLVLISSQVSRFAENGIVVQGDPNFCNVIGNGFFIETFSANLTNADGAAIRLNNPRGNTQIYMSGILCNLGNTDATFFKVDTPLFIDNIALEGMGQQITTPYDFGGATIGDIGTNYLDKMRFFNSGTVTKRVGFKNNDITDMHGESNTFDISGTGLKIIGRYGSIGDIRIKKVVLIIDTDVGGNASTINLGVGGGSVSYFGSFDVPVNATSGQSFDVTDQLTLTDTINRSEGSITCAASGNNTGNVRVAVYFEKYA